MWKILKRRTYVEQDGVVLTESASCGETDYIQKFWHEIDFRISIFIIIINIYNARNI